MVHGCGHRDNENDKDYTQYIREIGGPLELSRPRRSVHRKEVLDGWLQIGVIIENFMVVATEVEPFEATEHIHTFIIE